MQEAGEAGPTTLKRKSALPCNTGLHLRGAYAKDPGGRRELFRLPRYPLFAHEVVFETDNIVGPFVFAEKRRKTPSELVGWKSFWKSRRLNASFVPAAARGN